MGDLVQQRQILFALASFDNLVKNGRVSKLVGFVAGVMNMRAVGRGSDDGKLEMLHKTRAKPACWPSSWKRWTTVATARCPPSSATARTKRARRCSRPASKKVARRQSHRAALQRPDQLYAEAAASSWGY